MKDWAVTISAVVAAAMAHVTWPVSAIAIALIFRQPIAALLGRVKSTDIKGVKATFGSGTFPAKLRYAEGMADALHIPAPPKPARRPNDDLERDFKAVYSSAAKRPDAAIDDASEWVLSRTCSAMEARVGRRPATIDAISVARPYVGEAVAELMLLLDRMAADHRVDRGTTIEAESAVRYVALCGRIVLAVGRAPMTAPTSPSVGRPPEGLDAEIEP